MRSKKISFLVIGAATLAAALISCETISQVFGSPEISVANVAIKSVDLEGITFSMDYAITNPYPLGFSVKGVAADVAYDGTVLTKLSASEGVSVASMGTEKNTMSFKIPYDSVLSFAKNGVSGRTSLPFSVSGNADLDLSAIKFLQDKSLTLPFAKDFEVPVFKPTVSVGNAKVVPPSLSALQKAFTDKGMALTKAISVATAIVSGGSVTDAVFDGIDLDMDFTFDVNVGSEGSAPWQYVLENCSLATASGTLADVAPAGGNTITSGGSIPMKATLNTLTAGKFIAQILNKSGTNPVFSLGSTLTFTDLPAYAQNLPLAYTKELSLSSIKVTK